MNKYTKPTFCSLPTAAELRESLRGSEASEAREQISLIFDADTFVEVSAYTKRGFSDFISTEKTNEFEGVICGYGAIDGKLVFAFVEDASRMGGAIDDRHAKKICDLYKMAISNGAPVIGIFNSNGTDVFEGTAGLAAYGRIHRCKQCGRYLNKINSSKIRSSSISCHISDNSATQGNQTIFSVKMI